MADAIKTEMQRQARLDYHEPLKPGKLVIHTIKPVMTDACVATPAETPVSGCG